MVLLFNDSLSVLLEFVYKNGADLFIFYLQSSFCTLRSLPIFLSSPF
jgi:hypothetical protein